MSDTNEAADPTSAPIQDAAPSSSEPSASGDGSGGSPPAPDAQAGATVPPAESSGDAQPGADAPVPIVESKPVDVTKIETSEIVETPTQGAAVIAGEPIPSAGTSEIDRAAEAATEPKSAELDHPYNTIQRIRTKLGAYGEECLKTVQPELEYLASLCAPDGGA